jgi:hypothetical protein
MSGYLRHWYSQSGTRDDGIIKCGRATVEANVALKDLHKLVVHFANRMARGTTVASGLRMATKLNTKPRLGERQTFCRTPTNVELRQPVA